MAGASAGRTGSRRSGAAANDRPLLYRGSKDLAITSTGSAVAFAGGVAYRWRDLRVGPELFGRYQLEGTDTSPVEALLGARYARGPLEYGLALGTGLHRSPGAAPFRAVVQVSWRPGGLLARQVAAAE